MYYIFRIVFIVILILTVWVAWIAYFKSQVKKGKQYAAQKIRIVSSVRVISVILLSVISFIPFEGAFIRFNSVEDSLKYKWIDMKYVVIHDEDDCAFAVKGTYEIYAFDKSNSEYGFVNYHSSIHKYHMPDINAGNRSIHGLYSAYNKKANKTFYVLNIGADEFQDDLVICDTLHFEYFAQPSFTKTASGYTPLIGSEYQVYAVSDGEPLREISVAYEGQQKTFIL